MDTETIGIVGLFALLLVVGLVLSLVFQFARKPFERLVDSVIPGDDLAVKISRQMRIDVDPDKNAWDPERFSVDLGSLRPDESAGGKPPEHPLSADERTPYQEEWRAIERLFGEAPAEAVRAADRLLRDLVKETGSAEVPLETIQSTNGDIGDAVEGMKNAYRLAQHARAATRGIELARKHEDASNDDLTQAMDHYRAIFDKLLA